MSSTLETFVKRTPAIVENKKFGLKVRLEAQRCITYGKLALSAQVALFKGQDRTSGADQPGFGGDLAEKLALLLQSCERILTNLMQDAYARHLGSSDLIPAEQIGKVDTARIPEDQQGELLNTFKEAKEQLQSYVAELDNLLAKQQPQPLPAATKPQPRDQPAAPIRSSNELERLLTEKFGRSGIRVSRAPESAVTAAASRAASGVGGLFQASAASGISGGAAAAAGTTTKWQLPSLSSKELGAAIQLTLKVAEMQAAITPRPKDMPAALGRGFGAAALRPAAATMGTRAAARAPSRALVTPVVRPTPSRTVEPRLSEGSSAARSVDRGPSSGTLKAVPTASLSQASTSSVYPSSSLNSDLTVPIRSASFTSQGTPGPIRLLAKPLESPVQRICSVSLSPFGIQVKPMATKPAAEVLKQLQQMRNPEDAWSCRVTWMLEVAKALDILHRHHVVHGCVTADNVVLSSHQSLGTASFDSMDAADESLWGDVTQLHAQLSLLQAFKDAASPRLARHIEFSPPELLLRGEALSEKSDVYTFGLFMVQLLTGWAPRNHASNRDLNQAVHEGHMFLKQTKRPVNPVMITQAIIAAHNRSPKLAQLLHRCLSPVPEQRPLASELVKTLLEETVGEESSAGRY